MNPILLDTQVQIYLLSEAILYLLMIPAFLISLKIIPKWDFGSFSQEQYALEREAYLVMTILIFAFVMKFLLLPYFVFAIDNLNTLVPGAMCAAGVISANSYGMPLLFVKLFLVFALILWMAVNHYDLEAKNYPWFKIKMWIFIAIFIVASVELWLDFSYFLDIDPTRPVSCCSALFGQLEGANPLPFGLDIEKLLILFYLSWSLIVFAHYTGQTLAKLLATLLFVYISYYAVVYFFGTYVYELPTHKCPFCMMQKEYHYAGYLIWATLFGGSFGTMAASICKIFLKVDTGKMESLSFAMLNLFTLTVSLYPLVYRLQNGVWL